MITNLNHHLKQSIKGGAEPPRTLVKMMLVVTVQGLSIQFNFSYAQFPCTKAAYGDLLFDLVWETVYCLERLSFKVMSITADGASTNCLFLRLHSPCSRDISNKVHNPYSPDRQDIYVFSDPLHLIKTLREQETITLGMVFWHTQSLSLHSE